MVECLVLLRDAVNISESEEDTTLYRFLYKLTNKLNIHLLQVLILYYPLILLPDVKDRFIN